MAAAAAAAAVHGLPSFGRTARRPLRCRDVNESNKWNERCSSYTQSLDRDTRGEEEEREDGMDAMEEEGH